MSKYLIAIDLDGTTLNDQSQISLRTQRTLDKLAHLGNVVSIITGRPFRISHQFYDQLQLHSPMANLNGAITHIPYQHWQDEYCDTVPRDLVFDLLDHQQELGIDTMSVEDKTHVWANKPTKLLPEFLPDHLDPNQILSPKTLRHDPVCVTVHYTHDSLPKLKAYVEQNYAQIVEPRVWGGHYDIIELIHRGIHKEKSVKKIANAYGIDQRNIIAFGDESNDSEMLKFAGTGVAMKNAISKVKQVANDVTPWDNNADGMARYLQGFFGLRDE